MGDLTLSCPLCCNQTFSSKQCLLDHLTNTLDSLYCPICNNKFNSLEKLTNHLSFENCTQHLNNDKIESKFSTLQPKFVFESDTINDNDSDPLESSDLTLENETLTDTTTYTIPVQSLDSVETDVSKMWNVELMKANLQTQELNVVKESANRYVIITEEHQDLTDDIVTKQNQDGTISLTSVKDMKSEPDTLIAPAETEQDGNDELYTCNTCGVSFSSVIEHIQNYHNNQEVVVEGSLEDNGSLPIEFEYDNMKPEEPAIVSDKMTSRRVITDTGDIVETPIVLKADSLGGLELVDTASPEPVKEQTNEKKGKASKRYIQVEKLCDSVIKDLKQTDRVPYHKVTLNEAVTADGSKVKLYKCMWCEVTVSALTDFKQHPCKALKYSCSKCTVSYDNAKSLCAHMKMHKTKTDKAPEEPEIYECEFCCTVFPTNKSLKLHKRMHDPLKARPIEAPVNSHNGIDQGRYRCNVCDKMIPVAYKTIHQNSHKTDTMLNCGICNKKFTSASYLEMHMNVHNMDKVPLNKQDKTLPYSCLYCDRRFTRPHEKVKHERIHTGEKPHSCEICGKSFRVSYCLTLHMRTHTGARPYACQYCGKRFKAHSVYNHHLLTHSDVRAYKCPYCPKAFKTSVQLAGHKNSHTKPFSCTHCNRPFASLYAVRVHTETHARSNNLKFSCALCGASYARAFALKDHVRQAHDAQHDKTPLTGQDEWIMKDAANDKDSIDIDKEMLTTGTEVDII